MADRHIDTGRTASTTFIPFVQGQGAGVLNGLAVAGGIQYHYVRVTLDGNELTIPVHTDGEKRPTDPFLSGIQGGPAHGNNGLPVGLGFDRELLVEIRSSVPSPQTVFWASYTITPMRAHEPSGRIQEVEGIPYQFRESPGLRVLIGPARWSRMILATDVWIPGEWITGQVELHTVQDYELPFAETVPLLLRPSGRARQFEPLAVLNNVRGEAGFELPPSILEERSDLQYLISTGRSLEIVADLTGFANYPATLG